MAPSFLGCDSIVQSELISLFTSALHVLCWDLHRCEREMHKSSGTGTQGPRSKKFLDSAADGPKLGLNTIELTQTALPALASVLEKKITRALPKLPGPVGEWVAVLSSKLNLRGDVWWCWGRVSALLPLAFSACMPRQEPLHYFPPTHFTSLPPVPRDKTRLQLFLPPKVHEHGSRSPASRSI